MLATTCVATPLFAGWEDKLNIVGFGDMGFMSKPQGATGVGANYNTFYNGDFDLMFNFKPADKIRISANLDFEDGADTQEDRGTIALAFFFAEYKKSDSLQFRFGKQFNFFGIYSEIQAAKVSFLSMSRPHVTAHIGMSAGGPSFIPDAITGASILGNLDIMEGLTYQAMLSNGSNPNGTGDATNPYAADGDDNKALTAKTVLSATDEWEVGASVYYENYANYSASNTTSTGVTNLLSYGLQIIGEVTDDFGLEIEVVAGSYQVTPTGSAANTQVDRIGYTIMPSYDIGVATLYTRYNFADADLNDKATYKGSVTQIIAGVNYEFFSQGTSRMVLKAEYSTTSADADTMFAQRAGDITSAVTFSDIMLQLAVSF